MHLANFIVAFMALLMFTGPVAGKKLPKCQCTNSHGKKMAPGDSWCQHEVSGWFIMTCDKSGCPQIDRSCAKYLYDFLCVADPNPRCTSPAEACQGCQEAYDHCVNVSTSADIHHDITHSNFVTH
ncbi:hypothetical protein NX059_006158 [Plenodomus lindquistii]|nr:hypothetical protein NX059_006158 [Plenodomus lindquistii]